MAAPAQTSASQPNSFEYAVAATSNVAFATTNPCRALYFSGASTAVTITMSNGDAVVFTAVGASTTLMVRATMVVFTTGTVVALW